jgi:hypothetical protein
MPRWQRVSLAVNDTCNATLQITDACVARERGTPGMKWQQRERRIVRAIVAASAGKKSTGSRRRDSGCMVCRG